MTDKLSKKKCKIPPPLFFHIWKKCLLIGVLKVLLRGRYSEADIQPEIQVPPLPPGLKHRMFYA